MPSRARSTFVAALLVLLAPAIARADEEASATQVPPPEDAPEAVPGVPEPPPAEEAAAAPEAAPAPASPPAFQGLEVAGITLRPMLQARFRYEGRVSPYGNGTDLADQHFVTSRVRLGLDARWRSLRIVMQMQDVRNLGSLPGQDDGSRFAVHQGFLQVGDERRYARLGRQEISYGDERMLGPLDWQMAARSFDALRLHAKVGAVELDAFGAMVRPQASFTVTPMGGMPTAYSSRGDYFAGLQASVASSPAFGMDAYVLYRHDGPIETAPTRDRDIVSPGLRITGTALERLSWTGEGTVQLGRVGDESHFAYGIWGDVRYALPGTSRTQLGVGGALGSGARATSERVDGFDNFYPTNHKFYGYADLFNLQNLVDLHLVANVRPTSVPVTFQLSAFYFAQQQATAPWTNVGGAPFGQSSVQGGDRTLGFEVDLVSTWKPMDQLLLTAGYSVFVPGSAAERLGHDDVQHWFFMMVGVETP